MCLSLTECFRPLEDEYFFTDFAYSQILSPLRGVLSDVELSPIDLLCSLHYAGTLARNPPQRERSRPEQTQNHPLPLLISVPSQAGCRIPVGIPKPLCQPELSSHTLEWLGRSVLRLLEVTGIQGFMEGDPER